MLEAGDPVVTIAFRGMKAQRDLDPGRGGAEIQCVAAAATAQHVVARTARDHVVAVAAVEQIVAGAAVEPIVAAVAVDRLVGPVADDEIGALGAQYVAQLVDGKAAIDQPHANPA